MFICLLMWVCLFCLGKIHLTTKRNLSASVYKHYQTEMYTERRQKQTSYRSLGHLVVSPSMGTSVKRATRRMLSAHNFFLYLNVVFFSIINFLSLSLSQMQMMGPPVLQGICVFETWIIDTTLRLQTQESLGGEY